MFNFKHYDWKKYNISLVIIVITLCTAGVFILKTAAVGMEGGAALVKKQMFGIVAGLAVMAIVSLLDYHFICRFVILYYILGLAMLAATKIPGIGAQLGSETSRWISVGGINIQPAELFKVILILTLATYYTKMKDKLNKLHVLFIAALLAAVPTALILSQPNLSSSIVMLFIFSSLVLLSGTSYKIIGAIAAVGIPASVVFLWYELKHPGAGLLNTYQYNRIFSFLNRELQEQDPFIRDLIMQQRNSINAISSGRLYGNILEPAAGGVDYTRIPVRTSDFIFSIMGGELGFIGCCIVILLFFIVIIKCVLIAKRSMDSQGMMIAAGVSAMFAFQIFVNMGVSMMILPNTGIPLPFFSYGLSSMISTMAAVGLVLNVGLQAGRNPHTGFSLNDL